MISFWYPRSSFTWFKAQKYHFFFLNCWFQKKKKKKFGLCVEFCILPLESLSFPALQTLLPSDWLAFWRTVGSRAMGRPWHLNILFGVENWVLKYKMLIIFSFSHLRLMLLRMLVWSRLGILLRPWQLWLGCPMKWLIPSSLSALQNG